MKPSVYRHAALVACALGLLGLFAGCYQVSVSFEPTELEESSSSSTPASNLPNVESTDITPSKDSQNTKPLKPVISYHQNANEKTGASQGTLRMSNQTNQPVRIALLVRQATTQNSHIPAHWDFAPQEGSEKGLLLSLPEGELKIKKGDILVAFAQDGSRRYWGPYVVGETPAPTWDSQIQEWQLVLSP